jgi:glucokinase
MSAPYPWLVADVGGTNARFGYVKAPGAPVEHIEVLSVKGHAGPAEAAQAYLAGLAARFEGFERPRSAALAVATAVTADRVVLTNAAWDFSQKAVAQALVLDVLILLNDFEAQALSLPRLGAGQARSWSADHPVVAASHAPVGTVLSVLGPGTGLGVGGVVRTRDLWLALPGEGGHATLAPGNDFEGEVLAVARKSFRHVSAERFLSGIGMPTLCRSVAEVLGDAEDVSAYTPEVIVGKALDGSSRVCVQTVQTFCAMLGSHAGNVAITLGARGGVFIGGGIVPRLGELFFQSEFRQRFDAKGRFDTYMSAIPTAVITDTLAALSGASLALEQFRA